MNIFTDLLQSLHIDEARNDADALEVRVRKLETELARTKRLLRDVILVLEQQAQQDVNGDGRIG